MRGILTLCEFYTTSDVNQLAENVPGKICLKMKPLCSDILDST